MAFRFFQNAIESGAQQKPNEMYRDLQQEFINLEWSNTTALFTIEEQEDIGSEIYNEIEAWVDSTVGDTTTGLKYSADFNKLIFKDLNHRVVRGQMYKFDNNYWLLHNYSVYSGIVQYCGVRRCNNRLKIVDPLNGKIQVFPCCVDYDMASPSQQTSRYIITPNNHAVVMVQGNDLSLRLLQTNTRFILSGRPFKLLSYQNAIEYDEEFQQSTLLYLDMYLDEIHDKDDLINDIADNGDYDYTIKINSNDMVLTTGATGLLNADIMLNGEEVDRNIIWNSDNKDVITINDNGEYVIIGEENEEARIYAYLDGNDYVFDSILITILSEEEIEPLLTINPIFNTIRQYESITFELQVEYNGQSYYEFDDVEMSIDNNVAKLIDNSDGSYTLSALEISKDPINIMINVRKLSPAFEAQRNFQINIVSMMG